MKPVTAVFTDSNYATAHGLWQWDYGRVLQIKGVSLPSVVEVHFSIDRSPGMTRIGVTKDGITEVPIPDSMLENNGIICDYVIYAYIYITDETSGQTIKKINLLVKGRQKPESFEKPEEIDMFHEVLNLVNDKVEKTESNAKLSQSYAVGGTGIRLGEDTDNAMWYLSECKRLLERITEIYDNGNVDGGTFEDWKE